MSKLRQAPDQGVYQPLIQSITQMITDGSARYSADTAVSVASLESIVDSTRLTAMRKNASEFAANFKSAVNTTDALKKIGLENVSEESLEAASIIMAASADPKAYHTAINMPTAPSRLRVHEHGASLGLEAFDNREIAASVEVSVAYQLLATRQDEFSETLFHTLVLTPDQAMYRATVERTFVTTGAKHKVNGDKLELKKTNILEAFRNADVLRNDSTKLVPVVTTGANGNSGYFVPTATIPHQNITVDGFDLVTAPISINANDFSLVALSQHPGLVEGGMFNQNDAIDHSIRLEFLYVQVTDGTTTEILKLKVKNVPSSQFIKTTEGQGKLVRLSLRTDGVRVSAATKTIAGTAATLLAPLGAIDGHLNLRMNMNADLYLDKATMTAVSAMPVTKLQIVTENNTTHNGQTHSSTSGLTFTILGYDLDGRRTNSTLRTRGLLADSDLYQEVFQVGLLPPFTVQRPRGEQGSKDVDTLVNMTHIAISVGAVQKLLEYRDTVADYFVNNVMNTSTAAWDTMGDIEGIAHTLITPYYELININLPEVINSIQSANKLQDIRHHFVDTMTEACYRMVQRTGYRPALEMLSGAANRKVQITAATDVVLPQYIMINGDDRTVGPVLDLKVVSSSQTLMLGKIFLVFTTDSKDFDPMHFGNLLWIPELVSKTDVSREGQHITETTVHPRWRHINNVPAMVEINVEGLTEVIQKRTALNVNSTLMNPDDLPTVAVPAP